MAGLHGYRISRHSKLFWLIVGYSLFACQLPGTLLKSIRPTESVNTPTPTVSPTSSRKKPIPITPTPIQATGYPGLQVTVDYPQPYLEPAEPSPTESGEYPLSPSASRVVISPTLEIETPSGYPTPVQAGGNTPYPGEAPTIPPYNPYPGEDATIPPYNPYPGGATQPQPGDNPYPQNTEGAPPFNPPSGPGSAPTFTASPDETSIAPIPPLVQETQAPPALPLATQEIAVPTLTPTRTPFLTPTPTLTLTPTPTRTALPAPPWVSAKLQATDPDTVKLAAGKPQLIEFFAFWSGPSQAMAPLIHGIEQEFSSEVNFIYLDIDDPAVKVFKRELGFRVEPHFFLLDGKGKVLQQWVGYVSVDTLRKALENALN